MSKEIHITVGLDGEITVEAKGFRGKGCLKATEAFEKALGMVDNRTAKPEMNAPEGVVTGVHFTRTTNK